MTESKSKEKAKSTLTDRQCQAIPHLLAARSLEEGCRQAKISKATVYGWLKEETFKDEIRRQREEIVTGALETLKANITKATGVFVGLLDSKNESIRHRAAKDIIEFTQKALEHDELERRLDALEAKLGLQVGTHR